MGKINSADNKLKGLIFDIQGHSVHDGPGTRTTVFMNGCPLNCVWCCNPEGLFHNPVVMYKSSKCKNCGRCLEACEKGALSVSEEGKLILNRSLCDKCTDQKCVQNCYSEALEASGKYYSIEELMKIFQRDRQFWGSRGGVTFSGGEPLLQKDFMLELLKECKKKFIHVTVETTACIEAEYFSNALNFVDWVFVDIKHMDSRIHKKFTGTDNSLIIRNITNLALNPKWEGFIVPRIPIISGYNDSEENIRKTAKFVKSIELEVINILPFHRLGESKYRQLGQRYEFEETLPPTEEKMNEIKRIIEEEGLVCYVGYKTPF